MSYYKKIKIYTSENGQISSDLLHEINNYEINIVIFPHPKSRIVPRDLIGRVDLIFKFPDYVHKSLYSHYNLLLKKEGKLIKINCMFLKHLISPNTLKQFIDIIDKYIEIYVMRILNKNMKLNIPSDIVRLIKQFTGNILINQFSKQEINVTNQ